MDLSLDSTQQLIQESAREFVRDACGRDVLVKLDRDPASIMGSLWGKLAGLGWAGMAIPEQYGGTGNSLTDVAVLFEELGAGPVPGPLFSSGVLCARLFVETATEAQKRAWLPRIASGERVFALALTEARYGWSQDAIGLAATRDGSGFRVTGMKLFVHDAAYATDLLLMVRGPGGGTCLLRIDAKAPGVIIRALDGFLAGMSEVRLDNVRAGAEDLIGTEGDAMARSQPALLAGVAVLCAYKVGGCRAVFDLSVGYSRERTQFQQPIGRFQRVQDHVIRIVNFLDAARWTTYEALSKLDTGADPAGSVHMAKSVASESYMGACDFAHEVHAGIGVVREYGLTLHTKMSRSLYHCLGAPNFHRRQLESVLGLVPP